MAHEKQFEKVLAVLREASPMAVTKDELCKKVADAGGCPKRISTYIWEVKNKAGVPVVAVKSGRTVVSWALPNPASAAVDIQTDLPVETGEEVLSSLKTA